MHISEEIDEVKDCGRIIISVFEVRSSIDEEKEISELPHDLDEREDEEEIEDLDDKYDDE